MNICNEKNLRIKVLSRLWSLLQLFLKWGNTFKSVKGKSVNLEFLVKRSFKNKGETNSSADTQELEEDPAPEEMVERKPFKQKETQRNE